MCSSVPCTTTDNDLVMHDLVGCDEFQPQENPCSKYDCTYCSSAYCSFSEKATTYSSAVEESKIIIKLNY